MARIFVYCDSPTAPTGFGRSAKHVLTALHEAGHELVQLAVNHDPRTDAKIPWKVYRPSNPGDPYGLSDLPAILRAEPPFDLLWTTFDPECPWNLPVQIPGAGKPVQVLQLFQSLRASNPGFRMLGWFPVDAGPFSDFELAVLGSPEVFDFAATMASHVHDLLAWTLALRGRPQPPREAIEARVRVIPHGVELDAYRISTEDERRAAKERLGFDPDTFLVVQVERNQPRKMPWQGFALLEALRHGRALDRPVALYQHMVEDEENQGCRVGYRMRDLAWRYGIQADADVRWPARSFTDAEMVGTTYAAADVVFSGSAGEGFQYPLWEALACGRRVVAPRDSARAAWLSHTPGAFLYRAQESGQVIRGSYNRRMTVPDIQDAATLVAKMVNGRPKYREEPEASRAWVAARADVKKVQAEWVAVVAHQLDLLREQRAAAHVTVSDRHDLAVDMRANLGLGDLVMAAPALRAFRAANPGKTVCLALPPTPLHRPLAEWLDMADAFQVQPAIPMAALGEHVFAVSALWSPPGPHPDWHGARLSRTQLFAAALGLPPDAKLPPSRTCPPALIENASAQMRQRFGVELRDAVVLALEGAQPNRQVPAAYVRALCERLLAAGVTPILLGLGYVQEARAIERVGVVNLLGKTDLMALLGIIGSARAVVAVDSLALHVAATMEQPTVALSPIYPAAVRLGHYRGPLRVLEPAADLLAGQKWPPLEHGSPEWIASIRPDAILRELGELLGMSFEVAAPC